MKMFLVIITLVSMLALKPVQSGIDSGCLKCICQAATGCKNGGCYEKEFGVRVCGAYEITKPFWIDCGSLGANWEECAEDEACAKFCVMSYMRRYGKYCTKGATPTCDDYARILKGGPHGCRDKTATNAFFDAMQSCLAA